MTSGLEIGPAGRPPRHSARWSLTLIFLAVILALIGISAAAYYYALRPVTLRIAVGPPNSDDLKVVQALSQAFVTSHSQIRLRSIQTDGVTASAQMTTT